MASDTIWENRYKKIEIAIEKLQNDGEQMRNENLAELDIAELDIDQVLLDSLSKFASALFKFFHGIESKNRRLKASEKKLERWKKPTDTQTTDETKIHTIIGELERLVGDVKDEGAVPVTFEPTGHQVDRKSRLNYQPTFFLRYLLDELAKDIEHLVSSRSLRKEDENSYRLAKEIGKASLDRAKPLFSSNSSQPFDILPYQSNQFDIRIVPYSNTAFIGIPLDAFTKEASNAQGQDISYSNTSKPTEIWADTNYMAISHEIGHLVFQRGQIENDTVPLSMRLEEEVLIKIAEEPDDISSKLWTRDWLEEIFADAFGCLVAGPLSVAGFQNILVSSSPNLVYRKTGKHPSPPLRSPIQVMMLEKLYDGKKALLPSLSRQIELLEDEWQHEAKRLWDISNIEEEVYTIGERRVPGKLVLEAIKPVVTVVCDRLTHDHAPIKPLGLPIDHEYDIGNSYLKISYPTDNNGTQDGTFPPSGRVKQGEVPWGEFGKKLSQLEQDGDSVNIDDFADVFLFRGWSDEIGKGIHVPG